MRLYFRRSALLPSGFGPGGGVCAGSYSRTAAGSRTQLEAGDEQVHEIKKNQSLDKTVNIDIRTKAGELGVPKGRLQ